MRAGTRFLGWVALRAWERCNHQGAKVTRIIASFLTGFELQRRRGAEDREGMSSGARAAGFPILVAVSYGPEAVALAHARGEVYGLVSKGLYLASDSGALVGLVDSAGFDGPATVRVRGLGAALGELKGCHGEAFTGDGAMLKIGYKVAIDFRQAQQWTSPLVQLEGDGESVRGAVYALRDAIKRRGTGGGLGSLADLAAPGPGSHLQGLEEPLLRTAGRRVDGLLQAWRIGDGDKASESAVGLLGLGPGLTPSGDDLLAGLLAVCRWSRQRLADAGAGQALAVWGAIIEAVLAEAPARTTRLSARLLAYAAEGIMYEPAMSLGGVLCAGRTGDVQGAAVRLFGLGHSSGTDMAVGMLLGVALCVELRGDGNTTQSLPV